MNMAGLSMHHEDVLGGHPLLSGLLGGRDFWSHQRRADSLGRPTTTFPLPSIRSPTVEVARGYTNQASRRLDDIVLALLHGNPLPIAGLETQDEAMLREEFNTLPLLEFIKKRFRSTLQADPKKTGSGK